MISTEISPDVRALTDALMGVSPGSKITYAELSAAIGRDVQKHRYLIESARRIAQREHGAVFSVEYGVGYARLTTEQLPDVAATARRRIRSSARKGLKALRQGAAKANDVSPETQRKLNAEISALALAEFVAGDKHAAPAPVHDQRPEPVAMIARRLFQE